MFNIVRIMINDEKQWKATSNIEVWEINTHHAWIIYWHWVKNQKEKWLKLYLINQGRKETSHCQSHTSNFGHFDALSLAEYYHLSHSWLIFHVSCNILLMFSSFSSPPACSHAHTHAQKHTQSNSSASASVTQLRWTHIVNTVATKGLSHDS